MQSIQLVELATVVILFSDQFIRGKTGLGVRAFDRYWQHSKTRVHRWNLALKATTCRTRLDGDAAAFFYAVAEEIMAADVLNRVWTGVAYSLQPGELSDRARLTLNNVALGHAEVRHRLLGYMAKEQVQPQLASRLDSCRKQSEAWTDLLLAFLPAEPADDQAFDLKRTTDYRKSIEAPSFRQDTLRRIVENVRDCKSTFNEVCPHENLNRLVSDCITTALGPDLLDSVGPFNDLWQTRLTLGTQDTIASVELLLAEDC